MRTAKVIVPLHLCVMTQSSWAESGQRAAQITARQAAKGRLAHQMCSVDMWPWRMDFSRQAWALMHEGQVNLDEALGALSHYESNQLLTLLCLCGREGLRK